MSILVATNGCSHADAALRLGAQIARHGCKPITLLTVVRHDKDRPQADRILSRGCELLHAKGLDVSSKIRMGNPAVEIIREAEDGSYDLVIVGQRQERNLVRRFLLGSTAVRVVEHAPCPVIVAKGKIGLIQRILLCDSGSEDPAVGLSQITLHSAALGTGQAGEAGPTVLNRFTELPLDLLDGSGEIVILHVMSQMSAGPGVRGKQLRSGTEALIEEGAPEGELLRRDIEALESLNIRARAKVRHGLVVEEILEEVQSEDYDLVVIGAYRGQGWQRILLDDLAHRIVIELDRPVLVVR